MMNIIFLGAPGAGKGTQAEKVADARQIPTVSTGNIIREALTQGTDMGIKAKTYIEAGKLVPDDVVIGIIQERLAKDDCANGFILDGFPRTIPQAEALDEAVRKAGTPIDFAVDIEVPDEHIISRMGGRRACVSCGATYHVVYNPPKKEDVCDRCGGKLVLRDDDRPETVKNRLDVYHAQTQPLIDYYKDKKVLVTVDGTQSMDDVFSAILEKLGE